MIVRKLAIINDKGLHARASAKFVAVVERFDADAEVEKGGMSASGDSIMGLLMLAAPKGSVIQVTTNGDDEIKLADALEDLVNDRFGEGI